MSYEEALAGIRAAYPADKRRWDQAHLWIGWVMRPLSFAPSAWLMSRGVTATQVTLATGVIAYGSLFLLASGNESAMLAGSLGIVLYSYLDCFDGNIARASAPEKPPRGKFFDQLVGHSYVLSYVALGLGLRGEPSGLPAWQVVHIGVSATDAWRALAFGAAAAAFKFFSLAARHDFWAVLGEDWKAAKAPGGKTEDELPAPSALYTLYCTFTELQSHAPLMALCLWLGKGRLFLAASAAVLGVEAAGVLALLILRASRLR